jgi:glycosyltransferase involved in cell wall biosynthesis
VRVLLLCDWFQKYAIAQAVALREAGMSVLLVYRDHPLEFGGSHLERDTLLADAQARGVEVLSIPESVSSVGGSVGLVRVLRAARSWRPDVVHAHDNSDPRLLLMARNRPLVLTIHDPLPHPGAWTPRRLRRLVRRRWISAADVLVVHSDSLRHELLASRLIQSSRIEVVPHGAAISERAQPLPPAKSILFFGRLEVYKGISVLLAAMDEVWHSRPEVKLIIAGAGPEAAAVPLDDPRVEPLLGYLPEDRIDDVFARASLVVLPYVEASQSGVGLLAISRGIPIVASRVGGLDELAPDTSYVVPPNDSDALAAALLRHLDDGDDARRRVLKHANEGFSWTGVASNCLALYKSVLSPA